MLSNMKDAFGVVFGGLTVFEDGVLRGFDYTDNGKGTMTKQEIEAPCKVQVDSITQSMNADGYAQDGVKLIILTVGLDQYLDGGRVTDDMEVEIPKLDTTYRIAAPQRDPINTHWNCRGMIKPQVVIP
jgi:hypothetical protein